MPINWGGAGAGALSGAGTGAMFGPWGAAIGGVAGGLLGAFSPGAKKHKLKPYSKEGYGALMDLIQNQGGIGQNPIYQAGGSYLQNLLSGNPEAFQAFEAPYKRQFEQEVIPGIAERFAGMGTGAGALSSSGLHQSLARAGEGLSTNLAALRGQLQMQALPQALGYAQQPYSNLMQAIGMVPQQFYEVPGQGGFAEGALGGMGGQGLSGLLSMFGGQGGGK